MHQIRSFQGLLQRKKLPSVGQRNKNEDSDSQIRDIREMVEHRVSVEKIWSLAEKGGWRTGKEQGTHSKLICDQPSFELQLNQQPRAQPCKACILDRIYYKVQKTRSIQRRTIPKRRNAQPLPILLRIHQQRLGHSLPHRLAYSLHEHQSLTRNQQRRRTAQCSYEPIQRGHQLHQLNRFHVWTRE